MTAPQHAFGEIIPDDLLERLREELETARDSRLAQLEDAPENDDIALAFREINEKALEEITAALERMDAGVYGICERCRSVISTARLEAVPQTRFCVACASK
ncbi:MAG TPA: TraR/DksA C4-type zinc finger protein [Acidimicrobiia bacterium]